MDMQYMYHKGFLKQKEHGILKYNSEHKTK
jgi:hypothetical protein